MQEIKSLSVIDGKSLLALDVEPPRFIVDRLIPVGLHILSGSAKIGKSWLALWLCQQVSTGERVWEFETRKCGTLYLALEDTIDRLHFRLSRITDNGSEQSRFTTEAENLSGSLIAQLEKYVTDYPDTGLIVIDTLQRVRGVAVEKNAYANDYDEVGRIKSFADRAKVAVLLIHHVRKMPDSDPFNMVSGSVGIIGAVDSMYVLEKDKRTENKATLHVTGRDIEDMQLLLEFDRTMTVWRFVSYLSDEKSEDKTAAMLVAFLSSRLSFQGTASELLAALNESGHTIAHSPSSLIRAMKEQALTLEKRHRITMKFTRTNSNRTISLSIGDGDGSYIQGGMAEMVSRSAPAGDGDGNYTQGGTAEMVSRSAPAGDGDGSYTQGGTAEMVSRSAPAGDGDGSYTQGGTAEIASPIPQNGKTTAGGGVAKKAVTASRKPRKAPF